jgi:sporulation protein YlmC with PRC-barrel domain
MNRLLTSSALVLVSAGLACAQTAADDGAAATAGDGGAIRQSALIGANVYAADFEGDALEYDQSDAAIWDAIGQVDDIVLTREGGVKAVIVDVGGFLGLGETPVAIAMQDVAFLPGEEGYSAWRLAIDRSREELKQAAPFERPGEAQEAEASLTETLTENVEAAVDTVGDALAGAAAGAASMAEGLGWRDATPDEIAPLTADALKGVEIFPAKAEPVGEIGDLVVTQDGEIRAAIVDVGGFLGLGERSVEIPFDQMRLMRATDGESWRAFVDLSKDEIEDMPESGQ